MTYSASENMRFGCALQLLSKASRTQEVTPAPGRRPQVVRAAYVRAFRSDLVRRGEWNTVDDPVPLTRMEDESEHPAIHAEPKGKAASRKANPRIMIVEDNTDTLALMQMILDDVGETMLATRASEALDVARTAVERDGAEGSVDIFLLDINLGRGEPDGVELLKSLRSMPAYQRAPAAAVTAYAMASDRRRLLAQGFDEFLGKPFTADELIGLVERLADRLGE